MFKQKIVFWNVYAKVCNQKWRNSSWCFEEQLEIGQNENLGESSGNFQFQRSLCQRKFKTYHDTLQHMQFCKEIHAIGQGETTGTIISAEPDNEMKYREEVDNMFTK